MTERTEPEAGLKVVAVSAGVGDPSSTRMLTDHVVASLLRQARGSGTAVSARVIELHGLAGDLAAAVTAGLASAPLRGAMDAVAAADGVVFASPVYKAGVSGLAKMFLDALDDDVLVAKPVALLATAGTPRHALVVDGQLRPLFAYLRALTAPTGLFAASSDWGSPKLGEHEDRIAAELLAMMTSGVEARIRAVAGGSYREVFGGSVDRVRDVRAGDGRTRADSPHAERAQAGRPRAEDVRFDTDLMRLATGGSAIDDDR